MNDGVYSHSGIPRSAFPDNVPTFSGHFHKPHTVGGRDGFIRYVGSPYQVRDVRDVRACACAPNAHHDCHKVACRYLAGLGWVLVAVV